MGWWLNGTQSLTSRRCPAFYPVDTDSTPFNHPHRMGKMPDIQLTVSGWYGMICCSKPVDEDLARWGWFLIAAQVFVTRPSPAPCLNPRDSSKDNDSIARGEEWGWINWTHWGDKCEKTLAFRPWSGSESGSASASRNSCGRQVGGLNTPSIPSKSTWPSLAQAPRSMVAMRVAFLPSAPTALWPGCSIFWKVQGYGSAVRFCTTLIPP